MAAEIKEKFGVDSELIASGGGCFEVTVDGAKVFSKNEQDRFPNPGEVVESMSKMSS